MAVLCPFNDLRCASCGYNLRGLSADDRCPECSCSVGISLMQSVGPGDDNVTWFKLLAASNNAGRPLAAMHLVLLAVRQAELSKFATRHDECFASAGDVTATEICHAVVELVQEDAKNLAQAKRSLRGKELLTSADIGRCIGALMTVELVEPTGSGDSPLTFNGLDTIERWLAT